MYEFKFHRPTTVRQAAGLLARQEEAKLLATIAEADRRETINASQVLQQIRRS